MIHKILIIEDDVEDQILFVETIHEIDSFYVCNCVGNGAEGLNFLKNTATLPSLILLDLNMPLMNGFEFLKKVQEMNEFKNIPIYIFSTSGSHHDQAQTLKLGAKGFFTKPNNVAALKASLNNIFFD